MTLRDSIRRACLNENIETAQSDIRLLLEQEPGTGATQFAANQIDKVGPLDGLSTSRIAALCSFTLDPVEPHLKVQEFLRGRKLELLTVPYQQWYAELVKPDRLDKFHPNMVLLLLHLEDVAPMLAHRHLDRKDEIQSEADRLVGAMSEAIGAYRERSQTPIVVNTFIAARRGVERYFDRRVRPSRQESIDRLNGRLVEITETHRNVFIFDYAQTVTDFGRLNWFDPVRDHLTRSAISATALPYLAEELSRFCTALQGPRQKVLAVDADNTIWGGVVGEDGAGGIATGGDYPGNAFAQFQCFLANLRASGVSLAMVSKNNLADVEKAFSVHKDMPLRLEDFAAVRINWDDKPKNLCEIAEEIGIGIDAISFVDDSPFERDLVRAQVPQVTVVDLEGPPSLFADIVALEGGFNAASLTNEDSRRADHYSAERIRRREQSKATDTATFLNALGLTLTLYSPQPFELDRVVQLFGKTNQFNLTTKRYTAADVGTMLDDPRTELRVAKLADRYGDYGLVGITVTNHVEDNTCEIDSLLLSCRVLGRNVEDALLAEVEGRARRAGREKLIGYYLPTAKNEIAADLYPRFGFVPGNLDGEFVREMDASEPLQIPEHVTLKIVNG